MNIKVYSPSTETSRKAWVSSMDQYNKMYDKSIRDPEEFWSDVAERITWYKKWDKVRSYDFGSADIKFFEGAKLNVSYNCLDRHVENGFGDYVALIWEGNNPKEDKKYTYSELLEDVSRFANVLRNNGIQKGDRICIYMQMTEK